MAEIKHPYAAPDMAVAFTCPGCGHRNLTECVPIELNDDDIADAIAQGCDPSHRRDGWIGCPDESECEKCGLTVCHLDPEKGRSYGEGGWTGDSED